jgi:hypothetical protein
MIDPIKQHLRGYAATLSALDLIRRGAAPAEAAARLLIELSGNDDCLESFADKELRQLANKLNRAAQNLIRCAHATHSIFSDALEDVGAITTAARTPSKTSPERREYMKSLMRRRRAAERAERNAAAPADH